MDEDSKVRVMIVEGVALTRLALRTLSMGHPRFEVCAEAVDAPEARALCAAVKPDVIVLDLAVPRGDGVELLRELARLHPMAKALVVSQCEDELSLQRAFRAGARGYVSLHEDPEEVVAGMEQVVLGQLFASRRVSHLLLSQMAQRPSRRGAAWDVATLSDRELHVFRRLGIGLGATAIGRDLGVSVKTVETHFGRIKEKLGVTTASELRQRAEDWVRREQRVVSSTQSLNRLR
jgi:DNA-binding NarL/FixJ family response regulator